jgi:hypothetical protein
MPLARTSAQFSFLAGLRRTEATSLFRAKNWMGASYLAGYVAECALKALIASRQPTRELPGEYMTHSIERLVEALRSDLEVDELALLARATKWTHLLRYECKAADPN